MSKLTEDVKEALSKATPGPWELEKSYNGYRVVNSESNELICRQKPHESTLNNLTLIANAPELLRQLVEKVELYAGQMNNAADRWREELENAMFAEQQISKALCEYNREDLKDNPEVMMQNVREHLEEWKAKYDKNQELKWKRINDIITGGGENEVH
jgi:hypothetical protein